MKVLSLIDPWGTLCVLGPKTIETRGWRFLPKYAGTLLIHVSKTKPPKWLWDDAAEQSIVLKELGIMRSNLQLGCIVGQVTLTHARRFDGSETPDRIDRLFGDFTPGRVGLYFADPVKFASPIPCRGSLGIFDLAHELDSLVYDNLALIER